MTIKLGWHYFDSFNKKCLTRSKWAVTGLSQSIPHHIQLAKLSGMIKYPEGIQCNSIHPGVVFTDMTRPKAAPVIGDQAADTKAVNDFFVITADALDGDVPLSDIVDCFLLPLQDKRINGSGRCCLKIDVDPLKERLMNTLFARH